MEFSVCNNWRRQTRSISIKQPNSMKRVYRSYVSKSADAAPLVFSITRPPTNKIKFKGQLALDTVACRPIGCQFAVSEITRDNTEVERPDHRLWTWLELGSHGTCNTARYRSFTAQLFILLFLSEKTQRTHFVYNREAENFVDSVRYCYRLRLKYVNNVHLTIRHWTNRDIGLLTRHYL